MKRFQAIASALIFCATIAMFSCNEPLQIGTELLSDGDVEFSTTDTITIEAVTVQRDSLVSFMDPNFILPSHHLGWISDPVFGEHTSRVIFQVLPESILPPSGTVDSVVLSIEIDTLPIYGDDMAPFDIIASYVDTDLSVEDTYYSNSPLQKGSTAGATFNFMVPSSDSMSIREINAFGEVDTLEVPRQLRMGLGTGIGNMFLAIDSVYYTSQDSFWTQMNGFMLEQNSVNNAMLPLRLVALGANSTSTTIANNKIAVYYTTDEGTPAQFDYFVTGTTFSTHDHDYSTGTVQPSIGNPVASESLLYMQGAGGPSISLTLPHIEDLGDDVIVNEAKLIVTTELLPSDNRDLYPLPSQVYVSYPQDTLDLLVPDIVTAVEIYRETSLFGGQPETENAQVVYTFNLSEHIQSMITGAVSNQLTIQLAQNSVKVERAVFKGINDVDNPIKLEITYTEL